MVLHFTFSDLIVIRSKGIILLCVEVHGGALEICRAFLEENVVDNFDQKEVQSLKACLRQFIDVCDEGLAKNREISQVNKGGFSRRVKQRWKL